MGEIVRCPDCGKRLFDVGEAQDSYFRIVIVCRCKQRFRVVLPNTETGDRSLLALV
jgi:hypothetical protein